MNKEFSQVSIIGGGQIGTSLAIAIQNNLPGTRITVIDKEGGVTPDAFFDALRRKGVSRENITFSTAKKDIENSDLVILATPISAFGHVVKHISPFMSEKTILTDIGSVKEIAIERIQVAGREVNSPFIKSNSYVPGHIFNGEAGVGPMTATATLFPGKPMFLVPDVANSAAFQKVEKFYASLGADIKPISAHVHDQVVGTMSHLQHLLMFTLIQSEKVREYSSDIGGFVHGPRGMTRIADAGTEMWRSIFEDNRSNVIESARNFRHIVRQIADAARTPSATVSLLNGNPAKLDQILEATHAYAKTVRGDRGGTPAEPTTYTANKDNLNSAMGALMSVAVARNLSIVEKDSGISLATIANPSLKDGLGPIGIDAKAVKTLLTQYGPQLTNLVREYVHDLSVQIEAIRTNNAPVICTSIDQARKIRKAILAVEAPRAATRPAPSLQQAAQNFGIDQAP